jgi:hypothetical protein
MYQNRQKYTTCRKIAPALKKPKTENTDGMRYVYLRMIIGDQGYSDRQPDRQQDDHSAFQFPNDQMREPHMKTR